MFYTQLELLCKKNNTSVTNIAQKLGMSKGTVTKWKNGVIPNGETILKFAEHFGVSTDYLLLGKYSSSDLTDDESKWLDLYHSLSPVGRIACEGYAKGFIDAEK